MVRGPGRRSGERPDQVRLCESRVEFGFDPDIDGLRQGDTYTAPAGHYVKGDCHLIQSLWQFWAVGDEIPILQIKKLSCTGSE